MDTGDASVEINDETRAPRGPGQVQESLNKKMLRGVLSNKGVLSGSFR